MEDDSRGRATWPDIVEAQAPTGPQCPRCGSRDVHRSRTRTWERPLRFISSLQPYRCYACRWRGWRRARYGSEPLLIQR
ncbi:MAG: hypothetical protein U0Q55_22805 [Vicinamibacterales bacterium]